jgi:hypothetical protein
MQHDIVGGPRYLRSECDLPPEEPEPVKVVKPATVELPPARDASCIVCDAGECIRAYALLEHSSFTIDRRYKFMRSESIVQSSLVPHVFALCASCFRRLEANRTRVSLARSVAMFGVATGAAYFVAALMKASTAVCLALLCGGLGLFVAMLVTVVQGDRSFRRTLRVPALAGLRVVAFSKEREDILRILERRHLRSREIEAELQRMANDVVPLPGARVV